MRRLVLFAPFAVAALIAGCGSSSSSSTPASTGSSASSSSTASTPSPSSAGGKQIALTETEFKITPATASVAHAGVITITVKNAGTITHSLSVQTPSGVVSAGDIAPGASATLTVHASKAGSYTFFCPIDGHRGMGMQGALVVGSARASGGGGASPAPSGGASPAPSGGASPAPSGNGY